MGNLMKIFEVLQKGKQLNNKEMWKNTQFLTGFFLVLVQLVDELTPGITINDMDLHTIANGLTAIGLLFGSYLTVATTSSIGLK